MAAGGLGIAGGAATEPAALLQEAEAGSAVNGAIHSAATQQRTIGSVDDGIHRETSDIAALGADFGFLGHNSTKTRPQNLLSLGSSHKLRLLHWLAMIDENTLLVRAFVLFLLLAATGSSFAQPALPLMPMPAHIQQGTSQFVVNSSFTLGFEGYREPRLASAAARFLQRLSRQTGIPLPTAPSDSHAKFVIRCRQASAKIQEVGEDESYRLETTTSDVQLTAPKPLGIIQGLQTYLHL